MITSWVIGTAMILLLGTFYYFFKARRKTGLSQSASQSYVVALSPAQVNVEPMPGLLDDEQWWHHIDTEDQLDLAVLLAKKALPTWEKYAATSDMVYRSAGTGPFIKIDQMLLLHVLQDIQKLYLSRDANRSKLLHQYYDSFIGPVIAMHDGDWPATYPVKKIFLAVYNIIKSMLEQNNEGNTKNLLSISINQSLDCLDISGTHSKLDTIEFLATYKKHLQMKSF